MIRSLLVVFFMVCHCHAQTSTDIQANILYEKAFYNEEVIGNLDKALEMYNEIITISTISEQLRVNSLLRISLCLEKQGRDEEAQKNYIRLKNDFEHLPEITVTVNSQLQNLQNRYTEKIRKELEKKTDIIITKAPDEKVIISSALYDLASDYFKSNNLQYAKETLQRALSFNSENKDAFQLLQEVEKKLITVQDELFSRNSSEYKWLKGLEKKNLDDNQGNFKEILYDFSEILGNESNINDYTLKNNFLLLLKNELSITNLSLANTINFVNGNLLVKHNDIFHQEIEKILQVLTKKKYIHYANVVLASGDGEILQKELENLQLNFLSAEDGCFYSEISNANIQSLISDCYDKGIHLLFLPEIVLLNKEILSLEKTFEVPLVKGYEGDKVDFHIYEEGLQFLFKMDYEKLEMNMEIFAKKIQRPIETIPMPSGPLQIPFLMKQHSEFKFKLDKSKSLLALGLLNPISSRYLPSFRLLTENHRLIAFFTFQKILTKDFLLNSDFELDLFAKKEDAHYPKYYPISMWQKITDFNISSMLAMEAREVRNEFLLRFFNDYAKEKSNKSIFKIVSDRLLVYSTEDIHEKIQHLLNGLRENNNVLQYFSTYIYSYNGNIEDLGILKEWKTLAATQKKEGIQVYFSEAKDETLLSELKSKCKLVEELAPIICSNTQSIETANLRIKTFWEGITLAKSNVPDVKIRNVPEGFLVKYRNIFIGAEEKLIEVKCNIFEKTMKTTSYNIDGKAFSIKTPETKIQRGYAFINHKNKQKYLITGFQNTNHNYVFLILPSQIEETK